MMKRLFTSLGDMKLKSKVFISFNIMGVNKDECEKMVNG